MVDVILLVIYFFWPFLFTWHFVRHVGWIIRQLYFNVNLKHYIVLLHYIYKYFITANVHELIQISIKPKHKWIIPQVGGAAVRGK